MDNFLNLSNLITSIVLLTMLILMIIVARHSKKGNSELIFLGVITATSIWVLTSLLANVFITSESSYLFWARATLIGPSVLPFLLLLFIDYFPDNRPKISLWLKIVVIVCTLLNLSIIPTSGYIESVVVGTPTYIAGPLFKYFLVYLIGGLLLTAILLANKLTHLQKRNRAQIVIVLFGGMISVLIGVIASVILPLLGYDGLVNIGSSSVIFFILATGYAILKYQLLEIKLIISETVSYLFLIIFSVELLFSESIREMILRLVLLAIAIVTVKLLVTSTRNEIQKREQVEILARNLEEANRILDDDKKKLIEVDRMKDEFIQMATHELNTPISVIRGRLDMALEDNMCDLTKKQKDFLMPVALDAERLAQLSKDILDTSRIDQDRIKLAKSEVNLNLLIKKNIDDLKKRAESKSISLEEKLPSQDIIIQADQSKLNEIMTNLITNAIKFTKEGKILVELLQDDNQAVIRVKDTGIGINSADRNKLFDKFFQAQRFNSDNPIEQQGTGLGLYIVKKLIELHGGQIDVQSNEGKGSIFTVFLPLFNSVKEVKI